MCTDTYLCLCPTLLCMERQVWCLFFPESPPLLLALLQGLEVQLLHLHLHHSQRHQQQELQGNIRHYPKISTHPLEISTNICFKAYMVLLIKYSTTHHLLHPLAPACFSSSSSSLLQRVELQAGLSASPSVAHVCCAALWSAERKKL